MDKPLIYALIIIITFLFSYGLWVAGKHLSYSFMYEDMVKKTITEMVKQDALKGGE